MMKIFLIASLLLVASIQSKTLKRLDNGDFELETDMRLKSNDPNLKSLASQYSFNVWPSGQVPYTLSGFSQNDISTIQAAMALITQRMNGCITFVQRSSQSDYIRIRSDLSGCYSYIGKTGGAQDVSLDSGCVWKGTVTHELMHALGFLHEQNRPDRDQYVSINLANVRSGLEDQFEKYPNGQLYNTPYDYGSIMHYDEFSFSRNGQQTITPLQSGIDLIPSARKTDAQIMTQYDVQAVAARYSCAATAATTAATTPATTAATTVPTTPGTCGNANQYCNQFASNSVTYCSYNNYYVLQGVRFPEACRQLCGLCSSTVTTTVATATTTVAATTTTAIPASCQDLWYCTQFASAASTYCSTSGTTYTVNGLPFRTACPRLCNSCGQAPLKRLRFPKIKNINLKVEAIELL